jgi:hypothetical protein
MKKIDMGDLSPYYKTDDAMLWTEPVKSDNSKKPPHVG